MQAIPKLVSKVPEIIEKLTTALLEAIPTIYETLTSIYMEIIDFITKPENLMMILNTAIEFVTTMSNALLDNLPLIIEAIINMWTTCIEELTKEENIENLINTAIEFVTTIANALITNLPLLIEKLPTIIDAIVQGLIKLAPALLQAGWTIITKLGEALVEKMTDLGTPIKQVFEWIKTTMTTTFENVKKVGENLIKGLWNGINGMRDWVMQKIRKLCMDMLDTIKSFFGIESPSKVMANEVGKFMAEGIGLGFGNTMPSVIKAMQDKLAGATEALATQINLGDVPQVQGNQIVAENQYITRNYTNTIETVRQPQAIDLILDGTKIARAIIPPLNSEYNRIGTKVKT